MTQPTLIPVLLEIVDYLDELHRILQAEYAALSANDLQGMQLAAETKTRLTQIIEDLEQERTNVLKNAGLDLNKTGIMIYLQRNQQQNGNELQMLWQKIEQLSQSCEKQNKINGVIIEKNRQRTESALYILRGAENETELYSAAGSRVAPHIQKSLAKA